MSDVSTFTPRFLSAPRHVLALHAREPAIERILPAEAIASPPFPGVAEGAKRGQERTYIYVTWKNPVVCSSFCRPLVRPCPGCIEQAMNHDGIIFRLLLVMSGRAAG